MEIFFLGALLGVLFGGTLCAAYIRQEITARISPKLRHVELQLETVRGPAEPGCHDPLRGTGRAARGQHSTPVTQPR